MRKFILPGFLTVIVATALILFTLASGSLFNGGSAFGYGYGSSAFPPPSTPVITTTPAGPPPGATDLSNVVSDTGVFNTTVVASSEDNNAEVDINSGVTGTDSTGQPLTQISITKVDNPPPPPQQTNFIGIPYDFEPSGAKFDPAITIKFTYSDLPNGYDPNNLVVAFYDVSSGQWVKLTDITVDPVTHTITGQTTHFTTFAVLAPPAAPPPTTPPAPTQPTTPVVTTQPTQPVVTQPTTPVVTTQPTQPVITQSTVVTSTTTPAVPVKTTTGFNWIIIWIVLAVVVVLAVSIPLYFRYRRG